MSALLMSEKLFPLVEIKNPEQYVLIASGPLVRQPNTMPSRIVLIYDKMKKEYAIYNNIIHKGESIFCNGTYYKDTELKYATTKFAEQVRICAELYYDSLLTRI